MIALKRIIKYIKSTTDFGVWYSKDTNDVLAGYLMLTGLGMLMIEKLLRRVAFMWIIILSPG